MSIRSDLVDALKPLLPARIKFVDSPRSLDGLEAKTPVVQVYRESVSKAPNAQGTYFNTFALWIINPGVDVPRAEDALDDLLDQVVVALDQVKWLNWTSADRSVYGDAEKPAYKINLTILSDKE